MSELSSNPSPPVSWKSDGVLLAILVVLICLLCTPGMGAPMILDDNAQLDHVATFTSWKDCLGFDCYQLFRPFKNFAFYLLQDASLVACHLFTLINYLLAAGGIYALLRRMLGSPHWAFVGALMWATSPTHVSTAVWLSAFNLSLSLALTCACILCHDVARNGPGNRVGMSVFACVLLFAAQLSYETAVAVPGLCILVDLLRKRPVFTREAILRYGALALVTLVYLILRSQHGAANSVQSRNFGFSPDMEAWQLSFSAPWLLWKHFMMWIMPIGRIEFGSTYLWGKSAAMWQLVAAWIWLAIMLGIVWLSWKRLRLVAIGILWFLAASFPPSNFMPIWSGPIEDYYLIFPSVGLVMVLIGFARPLLELLRRSVENHDSSRKLIAGGLLFAGGLWRIALIPFFWLQADLWNQPLKLYLHAESSRPHQFQLQNAIAKELILLGNLEEAKRFASWSHDDGPWNPASSMVLGYVAFERGELEAAEAHFDEAMIYAKPGLQIHDFCLRFLGEIGVKRGEDAKDVRPLLLPLLKNTASSQHLEAIRVMADCYMQKDDVQGARQVLQRALELHPNNEDIRRQLNETYKGTDASPDASE